MLRQPVTTRKNIVRLKTGFFKDTATAYRERIGFYLPARQDEGFLSKQGRHSDLRQLFTL